jgi:putative membrane protein
MLFVFGGIWWLIAAGLVMSVGIIIDVYMNERENLGKVIVFPFFITAIGFILYCASIYILPVKNILNFPLTPEGVSVQVLYFSIFGIISAIAGMIIQFFVTKKIAELRQQEIIEVI